MNRIKAIFLFLSLCLSTTSFGQAAEYIFCIESETYQTFTARVVFKGLDFGENSAKQMVLNDLNQVLEGKFTINRYSESCPCENGECPRVEVSSDNWRDNFKNGDADIESLWGSAVEVGDAVISEGKALLDNPGEFLMSRIFGQKKD